MGKWTSAAVVAMWLVGCGPGGELLAPPEPETLAIQPAEPPPPLGIRERERAPLPGQDLPNHPLVAADFGVGVEVTGLLGAEGEQLSVLIGQAGCGFSVEAAGKATVVNGVARLTFAGIPTGAEFQVLVTFDSDHDGQCSEADTVWSGSVTFLDANASVSLDLTTLQSSSNWMCFAFDHPPAP